MASCMQAFDNPEFDPSAYQCWKLQQTGRFNLKLFVFAQKYRFDLAASFLSIVNFVMLAAMLREKVALPVNIPVFIIASLIGVWLFGLILDNFIGAGQQADRQAVMRSENWTAHKEQMDRIEKMLQKLK